jgi:predicted nucleic acid-binding protein
MVTVDANVWVGGFDTTDAFHERSAAFLREVTRRRISLHAPSLVLIEVTCVVARRYRDPAAGARAVSGIAGHRLVTIMPIDDVMVTVATQLGAQRFLRGADALYAATAQITGTILVSWDNELIQRAGAVTPTDWLAANP